MDDLETTWHPVVIRMPMHIWANSSAMEEITKWLKTNILSYKGSKWQLVGTDVDMPGPISRFTTVNNATGSIVLTYKINNAEAALQFKLTWG